MELVLLIYLWKSKIGWSLSLISCFLAYTMLLETLPVVHTDARKPGPLHYWRAARPCRSFPPSESNSPHPPDPAEVDCSSVAMSVAGQIRGATKNWLNLTETRPIGEKKGRKLREITSLRGLQPIRKCKFCLWLCTCSKFLDTKSHPCQED